MSETIAKMSARQQPFPHEIYDVDPDLAKELMEHYTGEKTGFVKVGPKGYFYPHMYKHEAADIYNMPIRPDDVFVNSFPRSGTTLTQELVWLIKNDLDYEKASETKLYVRFPMIEFSLLVHPAKEKEFLEAHKGQKDVVNFIKKTTLPTAPNAARLLCPRFMKTHLALSLLPPGLLDTAKVVYVARDPRDVAVSLFHLYRLMRCVNAVKDFKTHWSYFIRGLTFWGPYFEHVKEAWNLRNHPNLLFIFYEDLNHNTIATLRRVSTFFGKSYTDQELQKLSEHLKFDNFKTNSSLDTSVPIDNFYNTEAEPFLRKGKVGGWSEFFDEEMKQQAERWIADNLRDTDLRFPSYQNKQQKINNMTQSNI